METVKRETFEQVTKRHGIDMTRSSVDTLQVNMGKLCNQACLHCHVEAGPNKKRENMDRATVDRILELIDRSAPIRTVDITGGAPELNPNFRYFVEELRRRDIDVWDRCNLTVLEVPGQEETADFLAHHGVKVVASLPCYSSDNVDKQRGDGVFAASIRALQKLNSLGYGIEGSGLEIDLVYNPVGAHLPPSQAQLKKDYKAKLDADFGIQFNELYCITNMPIKRFLFDLKRQNKLAEYMQLLIDNFNPAAAREVMCLSLVSVSWDGKIFDCDFNQMLQLGLSGSQNTLSDIDSFDALAGGQITLRDHCFGCTAGAGSSCGGALT